MKKSLSLLLCLFAFNLSFGQQDKQLTHYMFDRMSFNPGATGFKGLCGTLIYRNQWDKVQDAPNTTLLNLQANLQQINSGVGISFTNDAIGFQRNNTVILNFAHHLRTNYGILSGGIGVGLINVAFSPTWVPPQEPNDPLLPLATSGTGFDVNAGLFWHGTTHPYYVGVSSTHLVPQTLKNINFSVARHYYVIAGYDFNISTNTGRKIELKPSTLIKADGATMVFDLNLTANYWLNDRSFLWGGASYRMADAVALSVGYAISTEAIGIENMIKVGYSFDIMTNPLNPYGRGTHELMVNFCLFPKARPHTKFGNPFVLD